MQNKKDWVLSKLIEEANELVSLEEEEGYYIAREWVKEEKEQWFMLNNCKDTDEAMEKMQEVYGYSKLWNAYMTFDDLIAISKEIG